MSNVQPLQAKRRDSPFSIRLNDEERARLEAESQGMRLGSYIKAKALGGGPLKRAAAVEDRRALSQALALIGQSRVANNLNQIAHAANLGSLVFSAEQQAALQEALQHVAEIRQLLLKATGLRKEA